MTALTADELIAWVENMSSGWRGLLTEYPEALQFPCDIRESSAVGDVVHGRSVKNKEALANPEALSLFEGIAALQS